MANCQPTSKLQPQTAGQADLPKLAVVGDVRPERTTGGELLLYRLLVDYPQDRLLVIDSPFSTENDGSRLSGVPYARYNHLPFPARLYATRFNSTLGAVTAFTSNRSSRKLESVLREFGAEVVVTVPQGFQWQLAVKTATAAKIPVVLICHDDWLLTTNGPKWFEGRLRRLFGAAYQVAAARLTVCPSMARLYEQEYGMKAEVLWPSRGPDSPLPRVRVSRREGRFVVAFIGSIFRESYTQLAMLAEALGNDGELHIYSRQELRSLAGYSNVRHCGFSPVREIAEQLSRSADALFASMEFSVEARRGAIASFPSKLADYTAIGLPILLMGPEYCSAVEWARSWPGVAVVIEEATVAAIATAIGGIQESVELRRHLAARAVAVGDTLFEYVDARDRLWSCLRQVTIHRQPESC
jgi:hypothetical protein